MDKQGLVMKYFVLKPDGDSEYHMASRAAMMEYANKIADTNDVLARELMDWALRAAAEAAERRGVKDVEMDRKDSV